MTRMLKDELIAGPVASYNWLSASVSQLKIAWTMLEIPDRVTQVADGGPVSGLNDYATLVGFPFDLCKIAFADENGYDPNDPIFREDVFRYERLREATGAIQEFLSPYSSGFRIYLGVPSGYLVRFRALAIE